MGWRISLKTKIVATLAISAIIAGGVAAYINYFMVKKEIYSQKRQDFALIVEGYAEEIEQIFMQSADIAETIAGNGEIREYLSSQETEAQDQQIVSFLENYHIKNRYLAIYLMDIDGEVLASTDPDFVGKNYNFRSYFQEAFRDGKGSEMAIGATSGEAGYYFSNAVRNPSGHETVGALAVKMNPEIVHQSIDRHTTGDVDIMLVDRDGIIVHANDESRDYKSLKLLTPGEKQRKNIPERFPDKDIKPLGYDEIYPFVESHESVTVEIFNDNNEPQKILSLYPMGDFPFFMLIKSGVEDIKYSIRSSFGWLILSVVGAILIVILIFIRLLASYLRPLGEIKEVTEKITAGDLDKRVRVDTADEFKDIAASFNKMVDRLVRARKNVEKKVEERTEELEKMNEHMVGREVKMAQLKKENKKLKEEFKKDNE